MMYYDFRFLTNAQYLSLKESSCENHWFEVSKIMEFEQYEEITDIFTKIVIPYLGKNNLIENEYAQNTLSKLYNTIRVQPNIHYFNEVSQEIDHVLDVFIRTNSGGTKLDFSELLFSIAVSHWKGDFKEEIDGLTKYLLQTTKLGFYIERDWILKTCLMLTESDVKFKVKNFTSNEVSKIQGNWNNIKICIQETFLLIRRLGINPQSLTSKNAIIPIAYYLYTKEITNGKKLFEEINNLSKHQELRKQIGQWFYMVLLKGIFGGQADSILSSIRDLLRENIQDNIFPLEKIIDKYKGTAKDLRFDEDYIDRLLTIQHGEGKCRALLHLLFPEMNPTEEFHIDHLHPKSSFEKELLESAEFMKDNKELLSFYSNENHWNSISNLHLLNSSQNMSKNDTPLKKWISQENITLTSADILTEGINLEFENFKEFYKKRRENLKNRLRQRVFLSTELLSLDDSEWDNEEVKDEIDS